MIPPSIEQDVDATEEAFARHRNMAEVLQDEKLGCKCELPRKYGHEKGCPFYFWRKRR